MTDETKERACPLCRRRVPAERRCDAVFCSDDCRDLEYIRRLRCRRAKSRADEFADLAAALSAAPPEAIAYRLGEVIPEQLLPRWIPELGRRTKRFDGRWCNQPYRLRPEFEPPRVQKVGLYAVELLDAAGQRVVLPAALRRGVQVVIAFPPRQATRKTGPQPKPDESGS